MINLDFKSGKSIHEQIQDGIKNLIMNGVLKEDDQLPSVRELSVMLTVNPNTVQKAYKELENARFIYSIKAKGNFVAKVERADKDKEEKLLGNLKVILRELKFLGIEEEKIYLEIEKIYKEEEND